VWSKWKKKKTLHNKWTTIGNLTQQRTTSGNSGQQQGWKGFSSNEVKSVMWKENLFQRLSCNGFQERILNNDWNKWVMHSKTEWKVCIVNINTQVLRSNWSLRSIEIWSFLERLWRMHRSWIIGDWTCGPNIFGKMNLGPVINPRV